MRCCLIIGLWLAWGVTCAQVDFKVSLSEKHRSKIKASKDAKQRLKRYKKFYKKDSADIAGKWEATYNPQKKKDSLQRVGEMQLAKVTPDTAHLETREDSLQWAMQTLEGTGYMEDYQALRYEYQLDSLTQLQKDSLKGKTESYLAARTEKEARNLVNGVSGKATGELASQPGTNQFTNQMTSTGDAKTDQNLQSLKGLDWYEPVDFDAQSNVESFASNTSDKELGKAQTKLALLKKKYVKLPNSSNTDGAVKRKSLKGQPFRRRIFLGGNVSLQATDPIILDSDIQLGFKFNKDFSMGAGFVIRESMKIVSGSDLTGSAFGHSVFVSQDVWNAFFLYGEFQRMRSGSFFNREKDPDPIWQEAYYLGVGRELAISDIINLTFSVLYDFNYKNNTLHPRPWVIRIGYRLSSLALK